MQSFPKHELDLVKDSSGLDALILRNPEGASAVVSQPYNSLLSMFKIVFSDIVDLVCDAFPFFIWQSTIAYKFHCYDLSLGWSKFFQCTYCLLYLVIFSVMQVIFCTLNFRPPTLDIFGTSLPQSNVKN